ncbi:translation initiation factor IF-2 N-terminal domain-containing protein [Pediococcus acidilactici]
MGKKRIYELAKEINVSSKEIIEKAQADGLDIKNHMSTLDADSEKHLREAFKKNAGSEKPAEKRTPKFRSSKTGKTVVKKSGQPNKNGAKGIQRLKSNTNDNKNTDHTKEEKRQSNNRTRDNRNHNQNHNQNRNRNQNNGQNRPKREQSERQDKQKAIRASVAEAARMAAQANREIAHEKPQPAHKKHVRNNAERPQEHKRSNQNHSNTTPQTNKRPVVAEAVAAPEASKERTNNNKNYGSKNGNRFNNNRGNNRPFNKENRKNKKKNRKAKRDGRLKESQKKVVTARKEKPLPKVLEYSEGINVAEIAKKIHREPAEIIKKLFMMGVMVNQNQSLDNDTVELLAADYGIEAQQKVEVDISDIDKMFEDEQKNTDHKKTS